MTKAALCLIISIGLYLSMRGQAVDSLKATNLWEQAELWASKKKYDSAYKQYQAASITYKSLANTSAYIHSLGKMGNCLIGSGAYEQAETQLKRAIAEGQKSLTQNSPVLGNCLAYLGELYLTMGIYPKALKAFQSALDIRLNTTEIDSSELAYSYNSLGRGYGKSGDYLLALENYQKSHALNLLIYGEKHVETAKSYMDLGVNLEKRGDYGQALTYYQKSLSILESLPEPNLAEIANTYNNIGNSYYFTQAFDKAMENYQKAYQMWKGIFGENHIKIAYAYVSFGIIYAERQEYATALYYFNKERALKQRLLGNEHSDLVYSYNNLGLLYMRMGKKDKALESYKKGLALALPTFGPKHPLTSQAYYFVGEGYREKKAYQQALSYYQKALQANHKTFTSDKLEDNPPFKGGLDNKFLLQVLGRKGYTLFASFNADTTQVDKLELALQTYLLAENLIDHLRKSYRAVDSKLFLQSNSFAIHDGGIISAWNLWQISKADKYLEYAFYFTEKSKSSLLLGSVLENKALQFADIPNKLIEKVRDTQTEVGFYEKQRERATDSSKLEAYQATYLQRKFTYDSLIQHIELEYPNYFQLKYKTDVSSISDIQSLLPSNDHCMISYFLSGKNMYVIWIGKNGQNLIQIPKPIHLEDQIQQLRSSLYTYFLSDEQSDTLFKQNKIEFEQLANQLYDSLMAPILETNPFKAGHIYLIPDGILGYLPFDVLLDDNISTNMGFKEYPYLLRKFQFSYNYSATLWTEMREKASINAANILAIAPEFREQENAFKNVESYRRESLGPLLHNVEEAESITDMLGGKVLAGKEATEQNVRYHAAQYAVLHFATHGKVDDINPEYSFLALSESADSTKEDLLYVRDLYNWHLPSKMVVLSACETGIGTIYKGEGIQSLARAFSYAGAKSIVTTLWSVNDKQTAFLMNQFYTHLKAGKTKDKALHQAKLDFLAQADAYHAHPFFWGAYIPLGDMRPIEFDQKDGKTTTLIIGMFLLFAGLGMYWKRRKSMTSGR